METAAEAPTLRALLARRDLHLRLEGDDAVLGQGALDRPLRWVHSSDLADPTPFLSEGLALLTTGTQFQDAADDASTSYRAYVRRLSRPRRGRSRLRHRGGARRHPAAARRRVPCRADAAVRGALPHAVHRRGPRECRGDRRAVLRATQLGARRAARDLARGAAPRRARGHACAELARQLDAWVGLFDAAGTLTREHPIDGSSPPSRRELARRSRRRCCGEAPAPASSLRIGGVPFTLQTLGRGGHLRGRDRDGRRRPRPGGPRRRDGGRRDGGARPRAATGARPRTRRCCGPGSCIRFAATIPRWRGESRAICGAGCPPRRSWWR